MSLDLRPVHCQNSLHVGAASVTQYHLDIMQGSMTKEQKDAGLASVFKRDDDTSKRKELDARMRESAFVPDAYGECYPGYHELGTAVVDDDEADFTAMDSKVCSHSYACIYVCQAALQRLLTQALLSMHIASSCKHSWLLCYSTTCFEWQTQRERTG